MKSTLLLALATVLAGAPAMASEPAATAAAEAKNAPANRAVETSAATRALQARYPARPAEFRADGSVSQYLGASHLMQTVVRIAADGKLEELCTSDAAAARKFMKAGASNTRVNESGADQ